MSDVKATDIKEEFTGIYNINYWNSKETVSGGGSELKYTTGIRKFLPKIIEKYNIKSILDVGCGDLNWMKEINLIGIKYTGCDVVDKLIEENKVKYPKYNFIVADITKDKFDKVDLIICRNVLFHLSFNSINLALNNMKQISKYSLLTTNQDVENINVQNGDYRPIDLNAEPINLPKPVKFYTDSSGSYMGLWSNL